MEDHSWRERISFLKNREKRAESGSKSRKLYRQAVFQDGKEPQKQVKKKHARQWPVWDALSDDHMEGSMACVRSGKKNRDL